MMTKESFWLSLKCLEPEKDPKKKEEKIKNP